MSDTLIKGMKMQPEGEYHMTLYVCSDGSAYIDVASFPVDEDRFKAFPVPPHGRLIDQDAILREVIRGDYPNQWIDKSELLRLFRNAPTIIEPEEGE